jgi:NMD protein affecting ribosome stability and mRNA decay
MKTVTCPVCGAEIEVDPSVELGESLCVRMWC